jgi:hypothetical protein
LLSQALGRGGAELGHPAIKPLECLSVRHVVAERCQ